jgi:DNA invertase Pin-like site-specific DNA recombinase
MENQSLQTCQRGDIEAGRLRNDDNGRPATDPPHEVRQLRDQGVGETEIANRLNIGTASIYRVLAA